jgi:Holliday junction resolvase RusA-like endonuclease
VTAPKPRKLRIEVPGQPIPQNTGKVGRWKSKDGREGTTLRQPAKVTHYKLDVRELMRRAAIKAGMLPGYGPFFTDAPVRLTISAVFPLSASAHRKTKPVPRRRHTGRYGNCDNLCKAIADAGEGVWWLDDGQICDLRVVKWIGAQGEPAGVTVEVEELDAEEFEAGSDGRTPAGASFGAGLDPLTIPPPGPDRSAPAPGLFDLEEPR